MSEEIKRKRGRPKTGEVLRNKQYRLLMTEEEFDELGRLSRVTGMNKADLLRDAIGVIRDRVEAERAEKFAYLRRDSDDDYGYFEEYEEEFNDDFG